MADRNPWLTRANGVLGAMLDPSDPWAQMVHEIWQRRLRDGGAGAGLALTSDRPQPPFVDASNDNVSGFPSVTPSAAETPWDSVPRPTHLPAVSVLPQSPSPLSVQLESRQPPARASNGDDGLSRTASWQSPPLLDQSPMWGSLVPAGYISSTRTRPWWAPPGGDFLADEYWKGMLGLYEFLRSRSGGSGGGRRRSRRSGEDDENECDERYWRERARCFARSRGTLARYLQGCLDRASQRWDACNRNGYPGGPGELREWGEADEETSRRDD
jgi:hypothetical protein